LINEQLSKKKFDEKKFCTTIILKRAKYVFLKYDKHINSKIHLSNYIVNFDWKNGYWADLILTKYNKKLYYRAFRFRNTICIFNKSNIQNKLYLNIIQFVYLMVTVVVYFLNILGSIWFKKR